MPAGALISRGDRRGVTKTGPELLKTMRWARLGALAAAFLAVLWLADRPDPPRLPVEEELVIAGADGPDADEAAAALAASIAPAAGSEIATATADDAAPEPDAVEEARRRTVFVRRGDTLMDIMLQVGLPRAEAHESVSTLRRVFDPRALKPGQEITFTFAGAEDGASLLAAALSPSPERDVHLARGADGRFSAFKLDKSLTRDLARATGVVRTSLFEAGQAAGLPIGVLAELIRAFSYDVDFQREVQPGDSFDVVFERWRDEDGKLAKDGAILMGALTL